ncbi:hypothetical protein AHF37_00276 [Paragonimus kellicotti]|nr:hypothetical protein AHF37_00276 [Paragonimus kellicotti]
MGNSTPARLTSFGSCERKTSVSNNCVVDRSRILTVDPRSPSEGIIRTPIQIDKCDNFHFEESDLKRGEVLTHATCDNSASDVNNFDSLNGLLTEDDSIHRTEIVEDGHSALSDTEVSKKIKNRPRGLWSVQKPFSVRSTLKNVSRKMIVNRKCKMWI